MFVEVVLIVCHEGSRLAVVSVLSSGSAPGRISHTPTTADTLSTGRRAGICSRGATAMEEPSWGDRKYVQGAFIHPFILGQMDPTYTLQRFSHSHSHTIQGGNFAVSVVPKDTLTLTLSVTVPPTQPAETNLACHTHRQENIQYIVLSRSQYATDPNVSKRLILSLNWNEMKWNSLNNIYVSIHWNALTTSRLVPGWTVACFSTEEQRVSSNPETLCLPAPWMCGALRSTCVWSG